MTAGDDDGDENGDNNDGEHETFNLTYYRDGSKIAEAAHTSGASAVIAEHNEETSDEGRFVGWNTKPDLSGSLIAPGSKMKIDRNISLYAMFLNDNTYAIILPEERKGFTITAEPSYVAEGGDSIISFSLSPDHIADDLVIAVNGNPIKLDLSDRIYLKDIKEDQIVTVTGVLNKLQHIVSLPEAQIGYVLTSSAERVHNGQSYTLEFELLPGYEMSSDFGIYINGIGPAKLSSGIVQMHDVSDDHNITVTGIKPSQYSISSGKNVSVLVDGIASDTATINDTITVTLANGYRKPATFDSWIKGDFTVDGNAYKITGDISFPSVLKITSGDNISIIGSSSKTVFVCPGDGLAVSASSGYSLPDNYIDDLKGTEGVSYSSKVFSFSDDIELPSIYKVVFNGYNKVHETFFVTDGSSSPIPTNDPKRDAYYFGGWAAEFPLVIFNNLSIESSWNPMTHTVFFGPNLNVEVGGRYYTFRENTETPPRSIEIKSGEKVTIKNIFDLNLPDDFGTNTGRAIYKNGHYEILEDCSFPGVTYIKYWKSNTIEGEVYSATIGRKYALLNEQIEVKEGYDFAGWVLDDNVITGPIQVENRQYHLFANWIEGFNC